MRNKDQWLLIAVLAGLLIMVFCYSVAVWQATLSMPLYGNIILGVATTLTLVAGCGLTAALMSHGRRTGHDEPTRTKKKAEDEANTMRRAHLDQTQGGALALATGVAPMRREAVTLPAPRQLTLLVSARPSPARKHFGCRRPHQPPRQLCPTSGNMLP
jgi:hypothetical protein